MPKEAERAVKRQGGVARYRTIKSGEDGKLFTCAVTRKQGPRGGRTVCWPRESVLASRLVDRLLEDEETPEKRLVDLFNSQRSSSDPTAYYEYPGYVSIPMPAGDLNVGTVNGFWGADATDDQGNPVEVPGLAQAFEPLDGRSPDTVPMDEVLAAVKKVVAALEAM